MVSECAPFCSDTAWSKMIRSTSTTLQRFCSILIFMILAIAPANAQEKIWRLGFLTPGVAENGNPGRIRENTLQMLSGSGFIEGGNLVSLPAAADGNLSRLPELARKLVEQRVDVIIAVGTVAARAAATA